MNTPLWYPPIEVKWAATLILVFLGAVANKISPDVRIVFTNPVGFFVTAMVGLVLYEYGMPPLAFAVFFFLLSIWAVSQSQKMEGFLSGTGAVDWVTNSKRWFVEKVLRERPLGIQEKDVNTYPVQGSSPQAGTSAGNT